MIYLKTEEDIDLLRISNRLVSETIAEVAKFIKPGITTETLNMVAETFIRSHGGIPSFLGYNGFPKSICTSVNSQSVHCVPSDYVLVEGDIISVDCGVLMNDFHGDSCFTFCVGECVKEVADFVGCARKCLENVILHIKEGVRLGDVGLLIQSFAEKNGYSVVKSVFGHGIGRSMHEEPLVPSYGSHYGGIMLREGMVISIEPLLSMGSDSIKVAKDGWTTVTCDESLTAQFEKTVVIRRDGVEDLSSFDCIDKILVKNN